MNHQATERKKWYYVPPLGDSNKPQGAYIISATIDGKKSTATIPAEYMQWKAGYQYTYIFKITVAMSEPHEIDYTLNFDSTTAKEAEKTAK